METPVPVPLGDGRFAVREVEHSVGPVRIELVRQFRGYRIIERAVEDERATGRHWCYADYTAAGVAAALWDGGETTEPAGYWRRGGAPLALTWARA